MKNFTLLLIALLISATNLYAFDGGESWDAEAAATAEPSHTLPILYINTENGQEIDQKITYIDGSYWLDASADDRYEDIGSADKMLPLGIRGRGNATWTHDKKPYKLKLDKKASMCGLPKSKHWALMTFNGGNGALFGSPLGMEIARNVMKCWTPTFVPVEVVLNGQYIGMYFLAETVRIEENRLNISEQPEGNEGESSLRNGYLVELDNNDDENQIILPGPDDRTFRFTVKTPDPFTEPQKDFVTEEFTKLISIAYGDDKLSDELGEFVDLESLARHYIVEEVMHNTDGYSGSCYWYKDADDDKWRLGPMWDIGDAICISEEKFIYEYAGYSRKIIAEFVKFPAFMKMVQKIWPEYVSIDASKWSEFANNWADLIKDAFVANKVVWNLRRSVTLESEMEYTIRMIKQKSAWLDQQWSEPLTCEVTSTVTPEGAGSIGMCGRPNDSFTVFRDSTYMVDIIPAKDYKPSKIYLNGSDVTDKLVGNQLELPAIDSDVQIDVEFEEGDFDSIDEITFESATVNVDNNFIVVSSRSEGSLTTIFDSCGRLVGSGTGSGRYGSFPSGVYFIKVGKSNFKVIL